MERGICFFSTGTKHQIRLVVSLHSLRKVYSGPVAILSDGNETVDRIGAAFGAVVVPVQIAPLRRHAAYCAKSTLHRFSPFPTTLLVDSDTTFAADPSPLFDFAQEAIVFTRFSDWITQGNIVRSRIEKWHGVKCDGINVEELIRLSLEAPHAAINTGCVAWKKDDPFLADWERLTYAGWRCPFTDELSANILLRKHKHVLVGDMFNCSPLYGMNKDKAVMWHQHGGKNLRPEAIGTWLPHFLECWQQDISGVQSWIPEDERSKYQEYL